MKIYSKFLNKRALRFLLNLIDGLYVLVHNFFSMEISFTHMSKTKMIILPSPQTKPPLINEIITTNLVIKIQKLCFLSLLQSIIKLCRFCLFNIFKLQPLYSLLFIHPDYNSHLTCFSNICPSKLPLYYTCKISNYIPHFLNKDLCSSPLQSKIFRLTFKALTTQFHLSF